MAQWFHIYLQSADGWDFTTVLAKRLQLADETWYCSLIDLRLSSAPRQPLYLCCDQCEESLVATRALPTLGRVEGERTETTQSIYVKLRVTELSSLRLYLANANGEAVRGEGTVYCTLVFANKSAASP